MYQIPVYLISNSDPSLNYFNMYLLSLTFNDDYVSLQIKILLLLYWFFFFFLEIVSIS